MSIATDFRDWLRDRRYPDDHDPATLRGMPVLPMEGDAGGLRIDLTPVELGDGDLRAVAFTFSPCRDSRDFFGGGVLEYDLDVYLIGRTENDSLEVQTKGQIALFQSVASMEPALRMLNGWNKPWGDTRVISSTIENSAITSDEDLRTVTGSFEYTILVRR